MAEVLGDRLPDVSPEEEADRIALEWELNDPPRPAS